MKCPSGNDKNVQVNFVKSFKTNSGVENEKALEVVQTLTDPLGTNEERAALEKVSNVQPLFTTILQHITLF